MNEEIALKILEGQEQILKEVGEMKKDIKELQQGQAKLQKDVKELQKDVKELKQGQEEIISEVSSTINEICKHIDKRLAKVCA